ncbi:MAG: four helix bundle protein [Bacteroidaceae bacterium]|nr:four helix bundle protein [Bacteroidaceae bacterium]
MTENELKERFKEFSKRIIHLVDNLPHSNSANAIGKQIVRSGTSPGANYRAACIGKSEKDFLNKLKMVEEELDETTYWLELIMDVEMLPKVRVEPLYNESKELYRIIVSSIISTREYLSKKESKSSKIKS